MSAGDLERLVGHWVRPLVRAMSAYHVADPAGMIKLDAMENPYTWPESLRESWTRLLRDVHVNRYPDPHARDLAQALRATLGIPGNMGLLLGNGSDEIIQMLAMTVGGPDRTLLSVEPGFVMYRLIAGFTGMHYEGVDLHADDFSLDLAATLDAIDRTRPAIVFLAVPNNPTGNCFAGADIEQIIRAAPGLVVVDEAYAPFTDTSLLGRLGEFDNLLVMRTLSKMGLAGLRLGLLAGPPAWTTEIDKTRLPYNINSLTQASAAFALDHKSVLDEQTGRIRSDRTALYEALSDLPGVTPFSSEANFILFRTAGASSVFEGLRSRGVLIKNLDGSHRLLRDCLRVTVGTAEENAAFVEALAAEINAR